MERDLLSILVKDGYALSISTAVASNYNPTFQTSTCLNVFTAEKAQTPKAQQKGQPQATIPVTQQALSQLS